MYPENQPWVGPPGAASRPSQAPHSILEVAVNPHPICKAFSILADLVAVCQLLVRSFWLLFLLLVLVVSRCPCCPADALRIPCPHSPSEFGLVSPTILHSPFSIPNLFSLLTSETPRDAGEDPMPRFASHLHQEAASTKLGYRPRSSSVLTERFLVCSPGLAGWAV
ncbi:hypothetical protein B0T13DRAFT_466964 [Neurospora crassa]|nr:hypothetical protein B0T13DRAFT_466964 [Neurospora crassa]